MTSLVLLVLISSVLAFDCGGTLCPDDNAMVTYSCSLAALCVESPTALGIFVVFILPGLCGIACLVGCIVACCKLCGRRPEPEVVYVTHTTTSTPPNNNYPQYGYAKLTNGNAINN